MNEKEKILMEIIRKLFKFCDKAYYYLEFSEQKDYDSLHRESMEKIMKYELDP